MVDAVVGNTDRHPGNWALLEADHDAARFLAPTYDHGSALGAGLTEANRRRRDPVAFAARGRANPFRPEQPSLVDLAHGAVGLADAPMWLERGRTGDTYELTPLPQVGAVDLVFVVHGIRHLSDAERASIDQLDVASACPCAASRTTPSTDVRCS